MSQNRNSFFLLTSAEITAFNWLKVLFSAGITKKEKNHLKRTSKKNRNFELCKPTNTILTPKGTTRVFNNNSSTCYLSLTFDLDQLNFRN